MATWESDNVLTPGRNWSDRSVPARDTVGLAILSDPQVAVAADANYGPQQVDANPVTNPLTQINANAVTARTRKLIRVNGEFTGFWARCRYAAGDAPTTMPTIQAFGFSTISGIDNATATTGGRALVDASGNQAITFTADASNDLSDGTYQWTTIKPSDNTIIDCQGAALLVFAVSVAAATATDLTAVQIEIIGAN